LIWQRVIPGQLNLWDNPAIPSLEELQNLEYVGSLVIGHMDGLTSLQGLERLMMVNGLLDVSQNANLESLAGLENLLAISSALQVISNSTLKSVDQLSRLVTLGKGFIRSNPSLLALDGFQSLEDIRMDLSISDNASLQSISGFSALERVGFLGIDGNDALESIMGLDQLVHVAGVYGEFADGVHVANNPILKACHGFSKLLDEIDHDAPGPGTGAVPDVSGAVVLEGNGSGCNTIQEILDSTPPFQINPGINDAWFNADTTGQGFFITTFPDQGVMFLAWFTYDTERPPEDVVAYLGEPGHRWLTAQGYYQGNAAILDAYLTEGGVFDMAEPPAVTGQEPIGAIEIIWENCAKGILAYDINPPGVMGEIEIRRIVPENVALCEVLSTQ
jgi:hypothetical protein